MFIFLQHILSFFHLKENLVYIQCQKPISPDIIYFIMGSNIRSTYQLDDNTLLVDLNVPTGELDFNLVSNLIGACNKYFWTYKDDTYILEASRANDFLDDPRIIQDYSFYLVEGYMPDGSPCWLINYYSTFIILLQWKVYFLHLSNSWEIISCANDKLSLLYVYLLSQLEWQEYFELRTKEG